MKILLLLLILPSIARGDELLYSKSAIDACIKHSQQTNNDKLRCVLNGLDNHFRAIKSINGGWVPQSLISDYQLIINDNTIIECTKKNYVCKEITLFFSEEDDKVIFVQWIPTKEVK